MADAPRTRRPPRPGHVDAMVSVEVMSDALFAQGLDVTARAVMAGAINVVSTAR